MTPEEPIHRQLLIDATLAARMARATALYRLTRPTFYPTVLIELVIGVVFLAAGHPGWGALLIAVALLLPLTLVLQSNVLAKALAARGYQQGTLLDVAWYPEQFVISTVLAHATHRYADVRHFRVVRDAAVLRMSASRLLLVLPVEVVPEEVRGRLVGHRR